MPRPSRWTAKITAKNQLTLPKVAMEALNWPTHFRIQVQDGALVLWPGLLVTEPEAAAMLGLDAEALAEARKATRERADGARSDAAKTDAGRTDPAKGAAAKKAKPEKPAKPG